MPVERGKRCRPRSPDTWGITWRRTRDRRLPLQHRLKFSDYVGRIAHCNSGRGIILADMKIKTIALLLAAPLAFSAALCFAARSARLKPSVTSPSKIVFQDDFSSG